MGLHYHTRICINYEKAHSTGTFNTEIENKLKHIVPQYPLPASLKAIIPVFDLDKSQTQVITFILIKRHRCHANRTILAIYQYKCKYIDNNWIVMDAAYCRPNYVLDYNSVTYRELDHINLFQPSKYVEKYEEDSV